jgi:hypothetical protein
MALIFLQLLSNFTNIFTMLAMECVNYISLMTLAPVSKFLCREWLKQERQWLQLDLLSLEVLLQLL